MIREFQIWLQNLNLNNIWPFLGQENSKTGKIPDLAIFDKFMTKEGFNCYSI